MKHKGLRITIGIITGFIALTAIGGGIALLSGTEGERFPLEWLQGTPFQTYTIPALLLTFIVGGSSLIACLSIFRNLKIGVISSLTSGIIMVGFIVVEVLILKQTPPGPTPIEKMYFTLGSVTFLLAGFLWRIEKGLLHQNQ